MHNSTTAPLPCSEQDATVAAFVVDVLEASQEVWDTAEAEDEADDKTPDAVQRVSESPRRVYKTESYCVVFPATYSVLVRALWRQTGQSTGAAAS